MSHTLAASRLGRWGVAMAVATVGMLSLAAAANATVFQPTNSTAFRQAVLDANATPGFDKIIVPVGAFSPTTNLTITDDLYITGVHSVEAPTFGEGPAISGGSVDIRAANFITVNAGVRLILAGLEINQASSQGFATIQNNGNLRLDGVTFISNEGRPVNQDNATGTVAITNTTMTDNFQLGAAITTAGQLTLLNSTITDNFGGGVQATGQFTLRNTVFANPGVGNCFSQPTFESNNWDTDGTCGNAATGNPQLDFVFFYGGPTQTRPPAAGSPLVNAGDNATCLPTDQGFFLRPSAASCDIGAVELNGVEDTIAPSCVVTATRRGPDEQDVTLSDTGSGIGYDGVFSEGITITNGTVAHTGLPGSGLPANPARPGNQVLTAVKANQSLRTRWSFIARDWAGNQRTCE